MLLINSPYGGVAVNQWLNITQTLVDNHPLDSQENRQGKKAKSGYYLAINFEKFSSSSKPSISLIRFGWLDAKDWMGQKASTGQQSRLSADVESYKLLLVYKKD